jgi:hypothetical protein
MMTKVRDLLARDLHHRIEEIIQVGQHDEETVYRELTEYVATDRITRQYREILKAIADAQAEPQESIGVWISGFFGSGKSSFAKNLGYVLANRDVLGQSSSALFKNQVVDPGIDKLLDFINARIPTEVIMFDVSVDRAIRKTTERITEVMYTVLLRELGYAEDYDIAELEIELEGEGRLEEFVGRCADKYNAPWDRIRKGAQKMARASAILHEMNPEIYPDADSWARSAAGKHADITVARFAERVFELSARRCPGKAIAFIIDEVGQYVARSADKIEDLRAVVERLGKEGKNRAKTGKVVAPAWVIVTSQEKLDEVVAAIDSRRVDLAKLQDRFRYRVDLAPADIREVATRRVLAKKPEAEQLLRDLYRRSQGVLSSACRLERTARRSDVSEADFVQFYPYLPHYIELSIDIMSGIRLQPGAPKHLGGSNRTMIKQAYEMLVSDRTKLADEPIGCLVTLDRIFELVEGNLSTERQKDISDIVALFPGEAGSPSWPVRVAKAICLLEFVRDLPRTEANIAALLVDMVGAQAPRDEVRSAIGHLVEAKFIRNTDEGYKLQTAQEKNWDTERRGYLEPKPQERNAIVREALQALFSEPGLHNFRYRGARTFRVGISVDGIGVGDEGQLCVALLTADAGDSLRSRVEEAREESRMTAHRNDPYWVIVLDEEMHALIANLHASKQMIAKYDDLRARGQITRVEMECLSTEKGEVSRYRSLIREKMADAIVSGEAVFRGVSRDGSDLGKTASEAVRRFLDTITPQLYPKLEMGTKELKGTEAEDILKAANLSGLPQVFYEGDRGLGLVVKEGDHFVVNAQADVASEILDYLRKEHSYGNRVAGKDLENHFGSIGYGWERDMLRLVMAALFRGGFIEVMHQGRRFTSYQDPVCRPAFTSNNAFKAASFAPRAALDIPTLVAAAKAYEELTGHEVDVEEGAIAAAVKKLAESELADLASLSMLIKARKLPAVSSMDEYHQTLTSVKDGASDDCVRILAGEWRSLKVMRASVGRVRMVLTEKALQAIDTARVALGTIWPTMKERSGSEKLSSDVERLAQLLESDQLYSQISTAETCAKSIVAQYTAAYTQVHDRRTALFAEAVDDIRSRPEWSQVLQDAEDTLLSDLLPKVCESCAFDDAGMVCSKCKASMGQIELDVASLPILKSGTLTRLQEYVTPERRIERVRVSEILPSVIEDQEALEIAIDQLHQRLQKLLDEGIVVVLE